MKVKIYYNKSVHENASIYYELAKKYRKKAEGAKKALRELEDRINKAKKEELKIKEEEKIKTKVLKTKEWYEKFHWFFTSGGRLAIGGKNAQQNEILVKRYMEEEDLFFHSQIYGGSVVILKRGIKADEREKLEVAQFAACFSRAWKEAITSIDVFAVKKYQLTKHTKEGGLKTGGFGIEGKMEWFKNVILKLKVGLKDDKLYVLPALSKLELENVIYLKPGGKLKKGEVATKLSKIFEIHPDEFLERLPSGRFYMVKE